MQMTEVEPVVDRILAYAAEIGVRRAVEARNEDRMPAGAAR